MEKSKPRKLSVHDRDAMLHSLEATDFDLVVIGGGITGAGVARDAASRGMKVGLIEMQDFAEGTSSRSSKLIHGGIRYLENMEFHLVFEALSERALLFEMAPTLVHPLRFVLPLYAGQRVGMLKMGLGMWLYDALSLFEAPELHERLSAAESVERLPMLQSQGLQGSYVYSDAYMDDDRLVHETLRSAVELGATVANRVKAVDALFENGKLIGIEVEDLKTSRHFIIRAKHFVSSVGPWTDRFGISIFKDWKRVLRPSKGVHLTFNRSRFEAADAVVMAADHDQRIVFGIPRNEMYIIGTTDTDFTGDPADVSVTPDDVKYLLGVASEYFPGAKLTQKDIVASYAGVRPLVNDGSMTESKTSREHLIYTDPRNITFVAGGKYTTYRRMANETVETLLSNFSIEDQGRFARAKTDVALNRKTSVEALAKAELSLETWAKDTGLLDATVAKLIARHALETADLLKYDIGANSSDDERMAVMEARHAICETMCDSLTAFYFRRMPLFLAREDHGLPLVARLSQVFQEELGWSDAERAQQVAQLREKVAKELRWQQG